MENGTASGLPAADWYPDPQGGTSCATGTARRGRTTSPTMAWHPSMVETRRRPRRSLCC